MRCFKIFYFFFKEIYVFDGLKMCRLFYSFESLHSLKYLVVYYLKRNIVLLHFVSWEIILEGVKLSLLEIENASEMHVGK